MPLVILALRCTHQEDLGATPAQLVNGQNLQLPGAFFDSDDNLESPTTELVKDLAQKFKEMCAVSTHHHTKGKTYVTSELLTCTHVFLRHDATKEPFQPPYDDPFRVISRTAKNMVIEKEGKPLNVSTDRTKPAFIFATQQDTDEKETFGWPEGLPDSDSDKDDQ